MARTLINAPARPNVMSIIESAPPLATDGRLQAGPPRNIIQRFPASTTAWRSSMPVPRHDGQPYLAFFIRAGTAARCGDALGR
jgi:hypothetical protein